MEEQDSTTAKAATRPEYKSATPVFKHLISLIGAVSSEHYPEAKHEREEGEENAAPVNGVRNQKISFGNPLTPLTPLDSCQQFCNILSKTPVKR